MSDKKLKIYTIGHSTRPIDEFISILKHYNINMLVDIRTIPRSRHNPQFNSDELERSLHENKIGYKHIKELGGLRKTTKDSVNTGWRNASFRGYADYMQTVEFKDALEKLIKMAEKNTIAIMCAEAVPWRCHRSLVADALLVHGVEAIDILSIDKSNPHKLTDFAKVASNKLTYPEKEDDETVQIRLV